LDEEDWLCSAVAVPPASEAEDVSCCLHVLRVFQGELWLWWRYLVLIILKSAAVSEDVADDLLARANHRPENLISSLLLLLLASAAAEVGKEAEEASFGSTSRISTLPTSRCWPPAASVSSSKAALSRAIPVADVLEDLNDVIVVVVGGGRTVLLAAVEAEAVLGHDEATSKSSRHKADDCRKFGDGLITRARVIMMGWSKCMMRLSLMLFFFFKLGGDVSIHCCCLLAVASVEAVQVASTDFSLQKITTAMLLLLLLHSCTL
jgi:hypothetical protein